jgi:pimeloyl-ACP methyl ester carboxylesterase
VDLLSDAADVMAPDLRGFGASDKHSREPAGFAAPAQAASVFALISELGPPAAGDRQL